MGKKKINAKNNIREYPYEGVRRDNRIKELAKKLKIKPYQLNNLLNQKLKPGIKVMGKRFFSNVDTMAGYLKEVGIKNSKNTPRSSVKPTYDPAMNVYGITDAQKLKNLSKAHGFHPSVINDALKAGARPKMLIKMMMHEDIPSDVVSKHIREATGEQWKKSNERKRSANQVKNKITKGPVTFDKRANELYKYQQKFGTKYGLVPQDVIKRLLKKGTSSEDVRKSLRVRNTHPKGAEWAKVIDTYFQEKLGIIDSKGRPTAKNVIKPGPREKWRPMSNTQLLNMTGGRLNNDQLRILNAYKQHSAEQNQEMLNRSKRLNQRQSLKAGLGQTAAYVVADVINQKYLDPLAQKLGTKAGRYLKSKFNGK